MSRYEWIPDPVAGFVYTLIGIVVLLVVAVVWLLVDTHRSNARMFRNDELQ